MSSVTADRNTRQKAAAIPGTTRGRVTHERAETADPERSRHLLEGNGRLRHRGPHAHEPREEHDRVSEHEQRRALIAEAVRVAGGEVRVARATTMPGIASTRKVSPLEQVGAADRDGGSRGARRAAPWRSPESRPQSCSRRNTAPPRRATRPASECAPPAKIQYTDAANGHAEGRQDEEPVREQDGHTGTPEASAHERPLGPRAGTADRPRPREAPSPTSTTSPRATSTSERAHATEVSTIWNSVKISVVKVGKPRISKAPYSARMTRATSRQPPRIARRAWPRVMRKNVARRLAPRLRAISSWSGPHRAGSPLRAGKREGRRRGSSREPPPGSPAPRWTATTNRS